MRLPDRFRPSLVEWLCLVVGAAFVVHHRWLFDDAFIYFRYVDNLLFLRGGLTYNLGEYVEGYTSPGFCLLLSLLRATRVDFSTLVLAVGLVSYAVFWAMLVTLNRRLSPPGASAVNLPLLCLVTQYGVMSFFTSGVETALVHVVAVGYALFVLRPRSVPLAILVAASPMARPELFAPLALAFLWAWWRGRRFPVWLAGAAALINGTWLFFRVITYADLLPNTFYLKDGTNWARGLHYLRDFTHTYHVVPAALVAAAGFLFLWSRRDQDRVLGPLETAPRLAMLAIALAVTGYVVRIGGAAIHYQYLAFPFVLAVCALAGLAERALTSAPARGRRWIAWGGALGILALVASFRHPLVGREGGVTDPDYHRRERTSLQAENWVPFVVAADQIEFAPEVHTSGYRLTTLSGWCRDLYVKFRNRAVHRFGLTDRILAQIDTPEKRRGHKPGLAGPARDILAIQKAATAIDRGMFREAVEAGRAPEWVRENLDTIEILEKKIYNRHDLRENLALAFTFPPRIRLGEADRSGGEADEEEDDAGDGLSGSDGPARPDED